MKRTDFGATIKAGRVSARATKWDRLKPKKGSSSHKIQRYTMKKYARCIVDLPMRLVSDSDQTDQFLREPGDELEAEQIFAHARRFMPKPSINDAIHGLLKRSILEGTVTCIIEKPMRLVSRS